MKITINEMINHLMDKNRHDILCVCSQCEKEFEEMENSVMMRLDIEEILSYSYSLKGEI